MLVSQWCHLPSQVLGERHSLGLDARVEKDENSDDWILQIACKRFARRVFVDERRFSVDDNYFHLDPLLPRRIRLTRRQDAADGSKPAGVVVALNGVDFFSFGST